MKLQSTRRGFIASASGLILGLALPFKGAKAAAGAEAAKSFTPNAFVQIGTDSTVTVFIKHLEMGQGPYTGLSTLVAEELDADWAQIRAVGAPANTEAYVNTALGVQGTGGSTTMLNAYMQMRLAGATAREMLIGAAALCGASVAVRNPNVRVAAERALATIGDNRSVEAARDWRRAFADLAGTQTSTSRVAYDAAGVSEKDEVADACVFVLRLLAE